MNKEVIKKYKDVFDYWLDGGSVLMYANGKWVALNRNSDVWSNCHDKARFIINDEYVELRKALADGKIIEHNHGINCQSGNLHWRVLPDYANFTDRLSGYRIKSDEPKFKVGDWVIPWKNANPTKIIDIRHYDKTSGFHQNEDAKLWQPKEGEWCVFWCKGDGIYSVRRFDNTSKDNTRHYDEFGLGFPEIAPLEFIQTLKDK